MSDQVVTDETGPVGGGVSRRDMIKRAAVVGGVVWTAPVIFDSIASPAGASTLPPCPLGPAYAVMYSPPGAVNLVDRLPAGNGFGSITHNSCTNSAPDPACITPAAGRTRTFAGSISLAVTQRNISHNVNEQLNGPQQALSVTLAQDSCCTIEAVYAYVHKFQSASQGADCPTNYCQLATPAGPYLLLTAGAYGTKSVTIQPSNSTALCNGVGVHWGSPNLDDDCVGYAPAAQATGQSFGFLLILLDCQGEGPA
jgi:hypothetical protein